MKTCPFCGEAPIETGENNLLVKCRFGHTPSMTVAQWNVRRTRPKPSLAQRLRQNDVSKRCRDCHPGTLTFIGDICEACRETRELHEEAAAVLESIPRQY